MSLLQEMEKHGLADCEFNRSLLESQEMTYEQWAGRYQPIANPFEKRDGERITFETFGEELQYVLNIAKADPRRVWTLIEGDQGLYIVDGYHFVNRLNYFITKNGFEGQEGSFCMLDTDYSDDLDEDEDA